MSNPSCNPLFSKKCPENCCSSCNLVIFFLREHKDRALMSLAAVLYHANHTHDSVVLLHTAMETCQEYSVYHFLLGNIYAVSTLLDCWVSFVCC